MSAAARTRNARGCSSASSSVSHSRATGAPNTLAVPDSTAGTPRACQRVADHRALVVGAHEHGDVTRHDRAAPDRGRARQQRGDVGGHVAHDHLPGRSDDGEVAPRRARQPRPPGHPEPERGVDRGAGQPHAVVGRADVVHGDAPVAQRRAGEDGVERVEQRRVAAPVDGQRGVVRRRLRGLQVADDVGAAEGVDRLLRVADQHQRGVAVEGEPQDVPLHRVGVLELVDQHDAVAGSRSRGAAPRAGSASASARRVSMSS